MLVGAGKPATGIVGGVMLCREIASNFVQSVNASAPMFVIVPGMTKLVNPVQPENAFAPISVTPSGSRALVIVV